MLNYHAMFNIILFFLSLSLTSFQGPAGSAGPAGPAGARGSQVWISHLYQ